jgi:hypothetical protein
MSQDREMRMCKYLEVEPFKLPFLFCEKQKIHSPLCTSTVLSTGSKREAKQIFKPKDPSLV